jgi:hypothetical protein
LYSNEVRKLLIKMTQAIHLAYRPGGRSPVASADGRENAPALLPIDSISITSSGTAGYVADATAESELYTGTGLLRDLPIFCTRCGVPVSDKQAAATDYVHYHDDCRQFAYVAAKPSDPSTCEGRSDVNLT